jgi:hypothetical protein
MKLTPVSSPAQIQQSGTPEAVRTAKAVAAFKAGASSYDKPATPDANTQAQPPVNANNISAEEIGAVRQPRQQAQGIETTEETQETVEAPAPKVEEKQPSQEWAKLARQEKALRAKAQQQEQQFKQREAALLAREAEATQKSEFNQKGFVSVDRLKADILGVAQDLGIPYDEIANQMINPHKVDPRTQSILDKMQAKIDSLEKATTEGNERQTQAQQQAYDSAVRQIKLDAKALVQSEPDTYEAIRQTGSINDVVELITQTFNEDGRLMTVEEAAAEVEEYLVSEAEKLSNMKKIQSRRGAASTSQQSVKTQSPSSNDRPVSQIKTLTNATSSTRKLSNKERALLAFKGELKG